MGAVDQRQYALAFAKLEQSLKWHAHCWQRTDGIKHQHLRPLTSIAYSTNGNLNPVQQLFIRKRVFKLDAMTLTLGYLHR